jgi:competence protein ComEA
MSSDRYDKLWILAAFLLIFIIVSCSFIIWARRDKGIPISIFSPEPVMSSGSVLVDGAVNQPGIYPIQTADSLESILRASGGTNATADLSRLRLYVPHTEEASEVQRVDINKAGAWLLEALPGIGAIRAEAIIQYRQQNGFFNNVSELTNVPGISAGTLDRIKDLIAVSN